MEPPIDQSSEPRTNLRAEAMSNNDFRRVIRTGSHQEIAVMAVAADGETGEEVHPDADETYVVVDGTGEARVGELALGVWPGDLVFIPAGTSHNIVNRAVSPLRLVTVCAPPGVVSGTVQPTKASVTAEERDSAASR